MMSPNGSRKALCPPCVHHLSRTTWYALTHCPFLSSPACFKFSVPFVETVFIMPSMDDSKPWTLPSGVCSSKILPAYTHTDGGREGGRAGRQEGVCYIGRMIRALKHDGPQFPHDSHMIIQKSYHTFNTAQTKWQTGPCSTAGNGTHHFAPVRGRLRNTASRKKE